MKDELRLLRRAHEEQAKRILAERVVAADRIRKLELRAEQLERESADAQREAADAHEQARRHVEAAREEVRRHIEEARRRVEAAYGERDAVLRELDDLRATPTYRLLTLVHQVLSRRRARSQ